MCEEKIDLDLDMKNALLKDDIFKNIFQVNVDFKELNADSFYVIAIKNDDLTIEKCGYFAKILHDRLADNGITNFVIIREKDIDLFEIKDNKLIKVDNNNERKKC